MAHTSETIANSANKNTENPLMNPFRVGLKSE